MSKRNNRNQQQKTFKVFGSFSESSLRYRAREAPEAVHKWCMDYSVELRALHRTAISVFTEEWGRGAGTERKEWTVDLSQPPAFPIRPYNPDDVDHGAYEAAGGFEAEGV